MIKKIHKNLKAKIFGATKPKKRPTVKAEELFNQIGAECFTSFSGHYYVPWISSHGDRVMNLVSRAREVEIAPLPIFKGIENAKQRHKISRSIKRDPDLYRRYLWRVLAPHANKIESICVSLDWNPPMRILVQVCRELGIYVNLIPHEAVFACRERYYKELTTGVDYPLADQVLAWGQLQKEIFVERGYPEERIVVTGAPKFDVHHEYCPMMDRTAFMKMYGLSPFKKTILFAAQPLDSQFDKATAQVSQNDAIADLVRICESQGSQLIVRMPPSDEQILSYSLRQKILNSEFVSLDHASMYLTIPEESLHHSDVVVSVNSTMLFEGVLMGKQALSMKYVEFDSIWAKAGIPIAVNFVEAKAMIKDALSGVNIVDPSGMDWAKENFSAGEFDGGAGKRVSVALLNPVMPFEYFEFMEAKGFGTLGYVGADQADTAMQLKEIFNFRRVTEVTAVIEANSVDFLLSGHGDKYTKFYKKSQKPTITVTPFGLDAQRVTSTVTQPGNEPIDFVVHGGQIHVTKSYMESNLLAHQLDWQGATAGDDFLDDIFDVGIVASPHTSADLIQDLVEMHDGKQIAVFAPNSVFEAVLDRENVRQYSPGTNRLTIANHCDEVVALDRADAEGFDMLREIKGEVAYA